MRSTESKDGPVSHTRPHRSDLSKVGASNAVKAFKVMLLDETCFVAAERLTEYWETSPDANISAIQYDPHRKVFVLTHRVDGEFTLTREKVFTLLDKNTKQLLSEKPLSEELRVFLERFRYRIKDLLKSLNT